MVPNKLTDAIQDAGYHLHFPELQYLQDHLCLVISGLPTHYNRVGTFLAPSLKHAIWQDLGGMPFQWWSLPSGMVSPLRFTCLQSGWPSGRLWSCGCFFSIEARIFWKAEYIVVMPQLSDFVFFIGVFVIDIWDVMIYLWLYAIRNHIPLDVSLIWIGFPPSRFSLN